MDIVAKLKQMKQQGKKVISIDYMIKELRGIPPTRQQTVKIVPVIDLADVDGYLHVDIMERLTMAHSGGKR
jgi:hypothetical protein